LVELKSFHVNQVPEKNIISFVDDIRKSDRVKDSVRQKDNWGMHLTHIKKCSNFGGYENTRESN
jgi:hypothetical protein